METLPDDHTIMQYSRCYRLFCGLNIHSVIFVSVDCRKSDHTFTRPNFDDSSVSIHGRLKWYYDQKITFIFSSDFETLFTKHSPSEMLSLNFDKKTVYLNCNFPI